MATMSQHCDKLVFDIVPTLSQRVNGIQGKQEWKAGTGTCKNLCYLLDSLSLKFTELCKPSHKYLIVVKFFLSHSKCQPAQNSISTNAICDLL